MIVAVLMMLAFASATALGQQQAPEPPQTYVVPASQLTQGQIAQIKVGETLTNLEQVGKYAGIGKEIGEGVSGALSALNGEVTKFGNTEVGHFTMLMIAWKIMGEDAVGLTKDLLGAVVGIPFFFLTSLILFWSYKRLCIPRKVLTKKGPGFFGEREYQIVTPENTGSWNPSEWAIAHALMFLVSTGISCAMIFH